MSTEWTFSPPFFLVGRKVGCWRCNASMPVVTIVVGNLGEDCDDAVGLLTDIVTLPKEIEDFVCGKVPTFKKVYSKTTQSRYYGNTCPKCGVLSGDFFLHSEPGTPFFPTSAKEASRLYMTNIPVDHNVSIAAGVSNGIGELILENAKKI